jgi:hypothetical protein
LIGAAFFALVLLEPVKSADPPMNSGMIGASASITFCEDWRVAIFGASAAIAFLRSLMCWRSSPAIRR